MIDSGAGGPRAGRRALVLALAVLLAVSAATAGVGTVAASSTAEVTADASEENPIKFVYVDGDTDNVTFVRADGTRVGTNATADIIGPMADLDSDGLLEVPYVTESNDIYAVDKDNETQFVASGALASKSKVGVSDWTGDGNPEVLYANASDEKDIYYANISGTPTELTSKKASAVLGAVDFDGDESKEVIYAGTSQTVKYYDVKADDVHSLETAGSNNDGLGVGSPAIFRNNEEYRVPMMVGNPIIVNASNDVISLSNSGMAKAPAAGVNWVGDSRLEVVHLNKNGEVAYTHFNETTKTVQDADGDKINALHTAGVARVVSYPTSISVNDFEANATGNQNVTVNVTTNHDLSELDVTLSGPENATLTLDEDDFEQTGANPYSYTATYDGSTDGEYEATVEHAASAGDSVSSAGSDTASVDEIDPVLHSVNLTDAANGDGSVGTGDTIEVTANATNDVGTVTANLSAFDAGSNVSLSRESGDTYNWTGEVGTNPNVGDQTANVTVSDGQGNVVSNETGNLTVDTGELSVELNDSRTVAVNESVEFSPGSVENASGDVTYEWEFGDGANESGETVEHTYGGTGDYVVNLTVSDETDETANASMDVTVKEPPATESVNLTDVTDENGVVVPGDRIEVAATVNGGVDTVTADLSAFGANSSVELTNESGSIYDRTVAVDDSATDGNHAVTVTATGEWDETNSAETDAITVDTDELSVALGDDRTVQLGETYEYEPQPVSNATGDVTYNWTFNGTDERTGERVDYAFDSTGTYTVELNASDASRDTANASMVVEVVDAPIVESANVSDETNGNGIVAPGDTVEVAATVSGDATSVTANLSAFGANESVELTAASGDTYNETVLVDSNATDGEQAVPVTVESGDYTDTAQTGVLTVDTDELDVSVNDTRTVDAGEEVEYAPADVADAVGDVDYEWEFGSNTVKGGRTVTHAFDSAATYEVTLTASDGSNDTASASMTVEVASSGTVEDTTAETTSDPTTDDDSAGGGTGGSGDAGGGTDPATETTTENTQTATTTQPVTTTQTTTAGGETTEVTATASETGDQTPAANGTDGGTDSERPGQTPGESPGFGAVAALLALAAAAGLALRE